MTLMTWSKSAEYAAHLRKPRRKVRFNAGGTIIFVKREREATRMFWGVHCTFHCLADGTTAMVGEISESGQ